MSNIFISYAHEDRQTAEELAQAFEAEHLSVFWDHELIAGSNWRKVLADQLAGAQAVVVLWSKASVESDYVPDEATIGKKAKKLIPVCLTPDVTLPIGFGGFHMVDLSIWDGSREDLNFRKLIDDLEVLSKGQAAVTQQVEAQRIQKLLQRRRRFRRQYTLVGLAIGGALGGGAAVFLLRTILGVALIKSQLSAVASAYPFAMDAAILGAGLAVGIGLADQLWKAARDPFSEKFSWLRVLQRRWIVVALLGTLCFSATHTALALLNSSWPPDLNGVWASIGAGAALSVALYQQPYAGLKLSILSWLWRLALVATAFFLIQKRFSFRSDLGTGLSVAWSSTYYLLRFRFWRIVPWQKTTVAGYLATIDAALLGMTLLIGLGFGIAKAAEFLARSLKSIDVDEP